MVDFSKFKAAILGILGLTAFNEVEGKESISSEECEKLKEYGFSDKFLADFNAYLKDPAPKADAPENLQMAAVAAALGQATKTLEAKNTELEQLKAATASDKAANAAAIEAKEAEIASLNEKIAALSAVEDVDVSKPAGSHAPENAFNLDDTRQLGGIQGEMYSLTRPYNQRARAALLVNRGMSLAVPAASSVDYKSLQEDLGAFYRRPWSERIQSFLTELPSIASIFPLESGHQDLDTLVNLWLGEFSQADSSNESDFDKVAKGTYEFGTETLRMYDVMFVHKFRSLKNLEKSWIGYLNREGSNPVKLSFIEYLLVETAKKLHNEQQLRYVNGVRKNPVVNVPGTALEAADGLYEYVRKLIEGHTDFTPDGGTTGKTVYQVKPFDLPEITPGNIGEVFYLGTSMIPSEFRDTGNIVLYVPSFMIPWYHKYNETMYGQNQDYKAGINYVKEYPSVKIVAVPNADNHHRIIWTLDGNIKTYTHVAGEMLKFNLEQQDWSMKVWSNWKESIQAQAVGYKYTDKADMDGSRQLIWCNGYDRPASYFVEAEKDKNPSALLHNSVVTVANSSVLTVTDIADAQVGTVVSVKCGVSGDKGVQIKKEGNFSLLTADWKPSKGNIIRLMKRADGQFIEIERTTESSSAYQFPADATAPSVAGASTFITGTNTKATAVTELKDAVEGTVYTIHGNGEANASTIANGGNFVLTAAITLKAGTYIRVVKGADGKFYEVARG